MIRARDRRILRQMKATTDAVRAESSRGGRRKIDVYPRALLVAKAPSGVPAIAAGAPGSATVNIYERDSEGVAVDTGRTETAVNYSATAVAADVFLFLERNTDGDWLVTWEDCV